MGSFRRAAACCCRNEDEPPGEPSDCFDHMVNFPRLRFKFDQDLPDGSFFRGSRERNSITWNPMQGILTSSTRCVEQGWYQDQWWKYDLNSLLNHCSLSCITGYASFPPFTVEPVNSQRCHLNDETGTGTPDPDEPNMGYVHRGFCPGPFSSEYLDGGQGPSWHTFKNDRSVDIRSSNASSAFAVSSDGPDFEEELDAVVGNANTHRPPYGDPTGQAFDQFTRVQNIGDMNAFQTEATYNIGSWELECWNDGTRQRYKFRAWFGCTDQYSKIAQFPVENPFNSTLIRNGCRSNLSLGNGVNNPCGFQDCGPVALDDVCPCSKGTLGELAVEKCLTSEDGNCASPFCRCLREVGSTNCSDINNQNVYEGCSLSQCGHGCFNRCDQLEVGRCNCPPTAPDTVWSHERIDDPDARPYSPPVHICSSNCDDGTGVDGLNGMCSYAGCCVPQANIGCMVNHKSHPKTLAIEWPKEDDIWMEQADPVAYFGNLTDEQNVGKAIGWLVGSGDATSETIERRITLESL